MMQTVAVIKCPLCHDSVEKLVYSYHLAGERAVLDHIRQKNPGWSEYDGACSRCLDYYQTELVIRKGILPEIGPHFPVRSADDFVVLPTGLRINADPRFTGKGVTICFIDSGFYPHPDLVAHRNRVRAIVDISQSIPILHSTGYRDESNAAWHGTMTSVVCAGDGYLGKGLYKGIASDAELVLLKMQDEAGYISQSSIARALEWVMANHAAFGIRIVNISLGDDEAVSYKDSVVDQLAEKLILAGIVVVAAVGNNENGPVKAPANSPNVITVGGVDDMNNLAASAWQLYHSTYGHTVDGLMKPELLAPSIWLAAPILPGTREQVESEAMHHALGLDDEQLFTFLQKNKEYVPIDVSILQPGDAGLARQYIRKAIQAGKYISPHYMHVDGTSFAAPITSSIIAQMLEINPHLTPAMIRSVLCSSARRLDDFPPERQGYGVVQPKKALLKILNRPTVIKPEASPLINNAQKTIGFCIQHDFATQISLAGSFNHWEQDVLLLEPGKNGVWKIEIPMLPPGRYQYKFFVDDRHWLEDVNNPWREPDGFSGFNSILVVEN